mgnify:CR=1 FL=1
MIHTAGPYTLACVLVALGLYGMLARRHADLFLAHPYVEGGHLRAGPNFRRRSCCLIYQVSGDRTAVCGDCVLTSG